MNTSSTNTLFPNHKILHEFNNKGCSPHKEPEWIFFGERHRPNYDPETDRNVNIAATDLLIKEDHLLFVESPSDTSMDSSSHPQTKNLKSKRIVYGCMDPEAYQQTKEIQDFIQEGCHLINSKKISKNDWDTFIKKNWKESWPKDRFTLPSGEEVEDEAFKNSIIRFFVEFWQFRNETINLAHLPHTQGLITILKKNVTAPGIIIHIGKNHLHMPKKLKELLSLTQQSDEMQDSLNLLHDYLQKSGKWCVILKPVRAKSTSCNSN